MKKACPCGQPQKVLHSGRLRLYPQTRGLPEKTFLGKHVSLFSFNFSDEKKFSKIEIRLIWLEKEPTLLLGTNRAILGWAPALPINIRLA